MKKQEYIKKDAIAHIMAKMSRWNITIQDLINEYERMMKNLVSYKKGEKK